MSGVCIFMFMCTAEIEVDLFVDAHFGVMAQDKKCSKTEPEEVVEEALDVDGGKGDEDDCLESVASGSVIANEAQLWAV